MTLHTTCVATKQICVGCYHVTWHFVVQGPEYLEVDATVSCVDGSAEEEVEAPGQPLLAAHAIVRLMISCKDKKKKALHPTFCQPGVCACMCLCTPSLHDVSSYNMKQKSDLCFCCNSAATTLKQLANG